jgi:hypothetical protein
MNNKIIHESKAENKKPIENIRTKGKKKKETKQKGIKT